MRRIRRFGVALPYSSNRVIIYDWVRVFANCVWTPSGSEETGYASLECVLDVKHQKIETDQMGTPPTVVAIGSIVNFTQGA